MSGRGNPHRGGMGSDGLPPRRDPFAVREQEGLGLHWSMLRAEAGLAIRRALTGNDPEHQAAIEESLQFLERFPREQDENDAELMVRLLSVFLDRIGPERQREGGMDAMDAIFWMTDAEWNEEVAINALTAAEEQDQNTEEYEESSEEEVEEGIRPEPEAPLPDAFDDLPLDYREINRLNPDVDRAPAVKGQLTPEKLTITLNLPEGAGTKTLRFNKYNQGRDMEWENSEHIRGLKRWRTQQLRRDLGPLREGRIYFHPLEREWITNLYKTYEADSKSSGKEPDYKSMPWDALTKDFNDTFEGRTLDDQTGKRPHRSKPSIMTERYRIPEVCRISGLKPKAGGKQKEKSDDEAAEDEDGGNAGDGKGKGKTPNKRGSKKG